MTRVPLVLEQVGDKWRVRRDDQYRDTKHGVLSPLLSKAAATKYKEILEGRDDDPTFVIAPRLDPETIERKKEYARQWMKKAYAEGRVKKQAPKMTKKRYRELLVIHAKEQITMDATQDELFAQMEKVRKEGRFNMYDRNGVMVAANDLDCYALVVHLDEIGSKGYVAFLQSFGTWLEAQE